MKGAQPPTASFDEMFPTIARWISQEEGWVELGADHYSRSLARALYGGGMVWEGTDEYGSLDEALRAMEEGIASWLEEHRPDRRTGGEVDRARGGSRRRAGEKAGEQARSTSPGRSIPRKRSSPKRQHARSLTTSQSGCDPSRPSGRHREGPQVRRHRRGAAPGRALRDHPPDEHQGPLQGPRCRPVVRPVPGRACPQEGRGEEVPPSGSRN